MYKVLTIAGSDCSGGAGIQADLKTITAHKMYGMSVITALTAQNTIGVQGILEVKKEFVGQQLDSVFTDIVPDAVKIGMLANKEIMEVIAEKLKVYQAKHIVLDPVMVSTSGSALMDENARDVLIKKLMPLAEVITPNIPEAQVLSGITIKGKEDMVKAACVISNSINGSVLIKGGHMVCDATDILYHKGMVKEFKGEKINNPNTHGTGCTLSSAIACFLAKDDHLENAVLGAKQYITKALLRQLDLGKGSGPLDHTCF